MSTRLVLGIMSGTSIDRVDYALCAVAGEGIELRRHWSAAFPGALQRRLHDAARGESASHELAQLHHDLGRFYARQARPRAEGRRAQLVGLHGQTVFHHPTRQNPATLQLGEPAYLVEALRVPVVSNFRVADLAAGGQGAPLATAFHVAVFARRGRQVCVQNLGGIANVTSMAWTRGRAPAVRAFDTGPANVLLDLAMRHFTGGKQSMDRNGAWAARGVPCAALLGEWLRHPYFARRPPKSTGRELFGEPFFARVWPRMRAARLSRYDVLATLTEFTAQSVVLNYRRHLPAPPDTVILTGGGAANPVLAAALRRELLAWSDAIEIVPAEAAGWPRQSIEAAAFAWLAHLRVEGQPGNLPATTGAKRPVLCGQMAEP